MGLLSRVSHVLAGGLYRQRTRGLGRTVHGSNKAKGLQKNGNFVCSTFSLIVLLALAMRGARNETFLQLGHLLPKDYLADLLKLSSLMNAFPGNLEFQAPQLGGRATEVNIVSRMYVNNELDSNEDYQSFYHSLVQECSSGDAQQQAIQSIDCSNAEGSADAINQFVAEVTRNHISRVIVSGDIKPETKLLLVSAASFSGQWYTKFDKEETKKGTFRALDYSQYDSDKTSTVEPHTSASGGAPRVVPQEVDFMYVVYHSPGEGKFILTDQYAGACLNYVDRVFAMCLIRPNNPEDLDKLMRQKDDKGGDEDGSLGPSFPTLEEAVNNLIQNGKEPGETLLHLYLPKFRLKAEDDTGDVQKVLEDELGIRDPFVRDTADFSRISGGRGLHVSKVLHKADIDVDEDGSTAPDISVPKVTLAVGTRATGEATVRFDSPFAFMIVLNRYMEPGTPDETLGHYVLFTGSVTDAKAAQK